jgi:hypothetical protein
LCARRQADRHDDGSAPTHRHRAEEFGDAQVPSLSVGAITKHDRPAFDHDEPGNISRNAAVNEFDIAGARLPEIAEDSLLFFCHQTGTSPATEWAHEGRPVRKRISRRVSVDPRKVRDDIVRGVAPQLPAPHPPAQIAP